MSSQDDQQDVQAGRSEPAAAGSQGSSNPWAGEAELDPTSGLPISHTRPEDAAGIDPTSGLPVSSLGASGAGSVGTSGAGSGAGGTVPGGAWSGAPGSAPGTAWGGSPFGGTGGTGGTGDPAGAGGTGVGGAGASSSHPWGAAPGTPGGQRPDGRRPSGTGRRGWLPFVVCIVIAAVVGALAGGAIGAGHSSQSTIVIKPDTSYIPRMSDPQTIISQVEPAVVSIDTTAYESASEGPFGGAFEEEVQGAGTGMIISSGGLVLTNNHVIDGATQIQVVTYPYNSDSDTHSATVVGTDPSEDLAVIQIKGVSKLPTVTFDKSKAQVGDSVLAIGNALALGGSLTVTEGIVSALNRSESAGDESGETTENLTDLIQTDAAINAGNSGGPLVNSSGEVIGMNTAVASSSAGNAPAQDIGFAIAAGHIQQFLPQLEQGGVVASTTAYIGVEVEDASSVDSEFNIPSSVNGAFVCAVIAGSPADTAGIEAGEVITGFNGKSIGSAEDLTTAVQGAKAGQQAALSLWNAGSTLTAHLTLGAQPSDESELPPAGQDLCGDSGDSGSGGEGGSSGGSGSEGGLGSGSGGSGLGG